MDMDTSSGEEDGQITRHDEEEERDRKLYSKQPDPDDEPISREDLATCRLTRNMLVKYCMAPWFEDFIKGKSKLLVYHIELSMHSRWLGALSYWA